MSDITDGVDVQFVDPGHVASGELIESSWGNAVVDALHELDTKVAGNTSQIAAGLAQGYSVRRGSEETTATGVFATVAAIDLGFAYAGVWSLSGTFIGRSPAGQQDVVVVRLRAGGADVGPWIVNLDTQIDKSVNITLTDIVVIPVTAANYRFEMNAYGSSQPLTLLAGGRVSAVYLGPALP